MDDTAIVTIDSNTTRQAGFCTVGFSTQAWALMIMKFGEASDSSIHAVLTAARAGLAQEAANGTISHRLQFVATVLMDGVRQQVSCILEPAIVRGSLIPLIKLADETD
jgi:hypothetical protein